LADSADNLYCGRFREKRFRVVEEWIPAEIEETLQFVGGFELARVLSMNWFLCLTSLKVQTCWTNNNVEIVVQ
jgi:hypothetical protein